MPNTININAYTFDEHKLNIITHLKTKPDFADADFSGGAINTLVDALAYVSHYTATTAHFSFNEMFMDTAKLRRSVVSKAKELGYVPKTITAAKTVITLSITNPVGLPANIVVNKGTEFVGEGADKNYVFTTLQSQTLTNDGNGVYSAAFEVVQGRLLTTSWTTDTNIQNQEYVVGNNNADSNTLSVTVKPSFLSTTIDTWAKYDNIVNLNKTDKVFFIQEHSSGKVQVYFGDDYIGAALTDGSYVTAEYVSTEGTKANGIKQFSPSSSIDGYASNLFSIVADSPAANGADAETNQSIKLIAPNNYTAQNRCVVVSDYKGLLLSKYSYIETLSVWGGEDNVPKQYGRVFASIKPIGIDTLTLTQKLEAVAYLNTLNIVGITPEIVDADFVYVGVVSDVEYYESKTTDFIATIQTNVSSNITNYFSNAIKDFGSELIESDLVAEISGTSSAIKSVLVGMRLYKYFTPVVSIRTNVSSDFGNGISPNTLSAKWTSAAGVSYEIKDDGAGALYEWKNGIKQTAKSIGDVDYVTGVVNIVFYIFDAPTNTGIFIEAVPTINNIKSNRNILVRLDNAHTTVNVVGIK